MKPKNTYLDGLLKRDKRIHVGKHEELALHLLELAEFDDRYDTTHFDESIARMIEPTIVWEYLGVMV